MKGTERGAKRKGREEMERDGRKGVEREKDG